MTDLLIGPARDPLKLYGGYCSYLPRPERVLIRYEITVAAYEDVGYVPSVYRYEYPVIGETAASWIFDHWGRRRHVLKGEGKRFAHENDKWAKHSLYKRVYWRQSHALHAVDKAHMAIDAYAELFPDLKKISKVGVVA